MSFDKDSSLPLVQPKKKTTQVNIGVAVAVILFFAIVGGVLWAISRNPEQTRSEKYQEVQQDLQEKKDNAK